MSDPLLLLRESRHVFSVCPECEEVHRVSDLQLSAKGRYRPDWLDGVESRRERLSRRIESLEGRRKELQAKAKLQAERRELPKLLRRAVPSFVKEKIDPRDVRTIFDPVAFVAFEGLNSDGGVRRVTLLHLGAKRPLARSIERAIERKDFGWNTVRVGHDGGIEEEPAGRE